MVGGTRSTATRQLSKGNAVHAYRRKSNPNMITFVGANPTLSSTEDRASLIEDIPENTGHARKRGRSSKNESDSLAAKRRRIEEPKVPTSTHSLRRRHTSFLPGFRPPPSPSREDFTAGHTETADTSTSDRSETLDTSSESWLEYNLDASYEEVAGFTPAVTDSISSKQSFASTISVPERHKLSPEVGHPTVASSQELPRQTKPEYLDIDLTPDQTMPQITLIQSAEQHSKEASEIGEEQVVTPQPTQVPSRQPSPNTVSANDLPPPFLPFPLRIRSVSPPEDSIDSQAQYLLRKLYPPLAHPTRFTGPLTAFSPNERSTETLYELAVNTQKALEAWQDEYLRLEKRTSQAMNKKPSTGGRVPLPKDVWEKREFGEEASVNHPNVPTLRSALSNGVSAAASNAGDTGGGGRELRRRRVDGIILRNEASMSEDDANGERVSKRTRKPVRRFEAGMNGQNPDGNIATTRGRRRIRGAAVGIPPDSLSRTATPQAAFSGISTPAPANQSDIQTFEPLQDLITQDTVLESSAENNSHEPKEDVGHTQELTAQGPASPKIKNKRQQTVSQRRSESMAAVWAARKARQKAERDAADKEAEQDRAKRAKEIEEATRTKVAEAIQNAVTATSANSNNLGSDQRRQMYPDGSVFTPGSSKTPVNENSGKSDQITPEPSSTAKPQAQKHQAATPQLSNVEAAERRLKERLDTLWQDASRQQRQAHFNHLWRDVVEKPHHLRNTSFAPLQYGQNKPPNGPAVPLSTSRAQPFVSQSSSTAPPITTVPTRATSVDQGSNNSSKSHPRTAASPVTSPPALAPETGISDSTPSGLPRRPPSQPISRQAVVPRSPTQTQPRLHSHLTSLPSATRDQVRPLSLSTPQPLLTQPVPSGLSNMMHWQAHRYPPPFYPNPVAYSPNPNGLAYSPPLQYAQQSPTMQQPYIQPRAIQHTSPPQSPKHHQQTLSHQYSPPTTIPKQKPRSQSQMNFLQDKPPHQTQPTPPPPPPPPRHHILQPHMPHLPQMRQQRPQPQPQPPPSPQPHTFLEKRQLHQPHPLYSIYGMQQQKQQQQLQSSQQQIKPQPAGQAPQPTTSARTPSERPAGATESIASEQQQHHEHRQHLQPQPPPPLPPPLPSQQQQGSLQSQGGGYGQ